MRKNGRLEEQDCSATEFKLWRNAEPSAFQLQGIMLKIDKI